MMASRIKPIWLCAAATAALAPGVAHAQAVPPATPPATGSQTRPAQTPATPSTAAPAPEQATAPLPGDPTQSAADPAPAETAPGDIVVTGIRQSLQAGLDVKRDAIAVVDSIVAEDIGRFPTQNIAEALQRIPGVNLDRDGGAGGGSDEGQRIQLRGLGPEFTLTTFNGAPVRTTSSANIGSATRDFNYDVFSSELFGRADVYKTPLAELEEGGVAGVVNLRTRRPFDRKGQRIAYSLQANYNDRSEELRPRGSLIYSNTWGNVGLLVGVAGSRNVQVRSGGESSGFYYNENVGALYNVAASFDDIRRARGQVNAQGNPVPLPAPGGVAGSDVFRLDFANPAANLNGFTVDQLREALVPRIYRVSETTNDRKRLGATGSLQYRDDAVDVSLDVLYAKLDDDFQRNNLSFPFRGAVRTSTFPARPAGATGPNFSVTNGTISTGAIPAFVPLRPVIDEDGKLQGTFGNVTLANADNYRTSETEFLNTQLNLNWRLNDRLTLSGQVARTRSDAETASAATVIDGLDVLHTITIDSRNPKEPQLSTDRNLLDPAVYNQFTVTGTSSTESDIQTNARLILDYKWDFGGVEGTIRTGGSVVESVKKVTPRQFSNSPADVNNPLNRATLPNGASYVTATQAQRRPFVQSLLTPYEVRGGLQGVPTSWLTVERPALEELGVFDAARAAPIAFVQFFEATERVMSGFVQSDFRFDVFERPLRANIGVRYVNTDQIVENFLIRTQGNVTTALPTVRSTNYDNWLPSASLAYNITPEAVLRLAYSKTLTRSALTNIARPVRIPSPFNTFIERGNPDLKPQISDNIDVIGEYYFRRGGYLSLGYFDKSLKNRALTQQQTLPFGELDLDPGLFALQGGITAGTPFTVNTVINDPDPVRIKGAEFAYQQPFYFLPKPLNGFGLIQSLTYVTTANQDWINFDGARSPVRILPKWTSFSTVYYERGPLDIRVSYSYRGEFFDAGRPAQNNGIGTQIWNAERGFVDAAIGYKIRPWLELRAEGQNLTETTNYFFQRSPDGRFPNEQSRIDNYYRPGRTFTFTVRGTF